MYTQCPDCETVFRVTAAALRTAQGAVRCGVCSTSFNALDNLSEEPFQPAPPIEELATPDDTITVEELPGTEVIELSTATETAAASEPPASVAAERDAMEFDATTEDLDRLLVEAPGVDLSVDPGSIATSLSIHDIAGQTGPARNDDEFRRDLDSTDEYPILVLDERDELEVPAARAPDPREAQPNPLEIPRILIPDEMRKDLADEALADATAARAFEEPGTLEGARRWPWTVGAAVLALLFAAQIVHSRRDGLLRQPAIGPVLAQVYTLIGLPLAAPTDLTAYELRQWGAATDAAQPGRLLLRASIVNRAAYAQPYPWLRLALQDRFGTNIGVRDIEPLDYLPGTGAANLLAPGQRADAEIRIVDPGREAVGFEMDVCLPSAGGVHCANEAPPAAQ